jgi:hypothetical protein
MPPTPRSPRRRHRGHRTVAFDVAALSPSRSLLDPMNPPCLRCLSPSRRLVRRHLWLFLTTPTSDSDYNRRRPPQPPSPSCLRLCFRHAVTMDTFLTPLHRLQPDCPNPASDGVRHHLWAPRVTTSRRPWVPVQLQLPPPPRTRLHLTTCTYRP